MQARREKVAQLYLRRATITAIATALAVHRDTVNRDINYWRGVWEAETRQEREVQRARELAALGELERDAATEYAKEPSTAWWNARMAALKRRAEMLGLDAPRVVEHTGDDGGPIQVAVLTVADLMALALNDPEFSENGRVVEGNGHVVD